jgi:predicted metal-dependent peptidase
VVNSNILLENGMQSKSITLKKYGESMHLAPDGKEGYAYTAEQVYNMLPNISSNLSNLMSGSYKAGNVGNPKDTLDVGVAQANESKNQWHWEKGRAEKTKADAEDIYKGCWDDHSHWQETEEDEELRDVWVKRFEDAAKAISIREASNCRGTVPAFAKRILEELSNPQINWRTILNDFIQEEICDYSFSPPDRRFDDNPFFLPDFNEKEEVVKDILFMIDTSGSMSNKMITAAYSEIKGAIDQFGGKLKGWLGFFDAAIIEPVPFEDEEEFKIIRPAGGGGTDFQIIFEYINGYMKDTPPASVIILTDGYAPFPKESCAKGVPVLWLINNDEVEPPWGKVARIKV